MDPVEEIKQRLDVAEVVGGYVQLKQAGRNLKGACPFHSEKTASFMVSPEKGIWYCFGACQEGGDIFKFVMKMEGLDFRGALEKLAARAGVELTERPAERGRTKLKQRVAEATAAAVKYYQASLVKNPRAIEYLKKRGIGRQSMTDFQIGFAPESWEGLTNYLKKKGFTDAELLAGGLAGQKRGVYDLFRGRLMLTICDGSGQPIGFTGRTLEDDEPKYLNTPQTPLFDKGRAIYGLHLAREAIRQADEVILVEGNLDVVSSHQAGTKQVVAASGTALTLDQLKILSRLTKNVKLAFDQDAAGLNATERAIELGQKLGLVLKMITIEGAKDPDELIKQDAAKWTKAIKDAVYIVDYLFQRFEKDYDLASAVGKRQYTDRLAWNIKRLADPVEQDHYVQLLAEKTGASQEAIKEKVAGAKAPIELMQPTNKPTRPASQTQAKPLDPLVQAEELVLAINLAHPESRLSLEDLNDDDFSSPGRQELFGLLQSNDAPADEALKALPNLEEYGKILTLRGEEEFSSLAPADRSLEAFRLARRLQTLANQKTKRELTKQLRTAESSGDTALVQALLERYQALLKEEY